MLVIGEVQQLGPLGLQHAQDAAVAAARGRWARHMHVGVGTEKGQKDI